MDVKHYKILATPRPLTTLWFWNLKYDQKALLFVFFLLYVLGTILSSVAFAVDRLYEWTFSLQKVHTPLLTVTLVRGYYRSDISFAYPPFSNVTMRDQMEEHTIRGRFILEGCRIISFRVGPCEEAAIFCTVVGMMGLYFHCCTFVLLRHFTILNISLAALSMVVGHSLNLSCALEYSDCLREVHASVQTSGFLYKYSSHFATKMLFVSSFTNFFLFLPMVVIGLYVIVFRNENL